MSCLSGERISQIGTVRVTDNSENKLESVEAGVGQPTDTLVSEANENRADLTEAQKESTVKLKQGGRSGITGEFGKPELAESAPMSAGHDQILPADPPPPIFQSDVEKDVDVLHKAMDPLGTDEEAIFKVLRFKTPERIEQLKRSYREEHGRELEADLRDELDDENFKRAQELLHPKGAPELDEKGRERLQEIQSNPEVHQARAVLRERFRDQEIPPEQLRKVEEDMAAFEKRAAEGNPPLSPKEIADTYREIGRLVEHKEYKCTSRSERFELAKQVLHQAADPSCIDQGYNGTCQLTALESLTYRKNPSAAARLVADAATTGRFKTADGTLVTVPEKNLHPDAEVAARAAGYLPFRSYASQVFQVTAGNIKYADQNAKTTPPGKVVYEDGPPVAGRALDTGERVMDYGKTPPEVVFKGHSLVTSDNLPRLSQQITGQTDKVVIQHDKYKNTANAGTIEVARPEDMQGELEKAKREGRLPIIVQVHTGNNPFAEDANVLAAGAAGDGGWHNVVVTDYNPETGEVYFDNSWGSEFDHTRSRPTHWRQLYQATKVPSDVDLPPGLIKEDPEEAWYIDVDDPELRQQLGLPPKR